MPAQLFQPFTAGTIDVKNRVVMALPIRNRADHKTGQGAQMQGDYDRQRAGAGHTDYPALQEALVGLSRGRRFWRALLPPLRRRYWAKMKGEAVLVASLPL